jgi:rhodanese-related sulfurtransferase
MGWSLAGFAPDSGKDNRAPEVSHGALAWSKSAAENVARKLDIRSIDEAALARLRADETRTLYLFDVRDPAEYAAGHLAGAVSVPGGQLVQATDLYVGTLGARIVLVDDAAVRALMTASWLRQMGWRDVFALAQSGNETGWPPPPVLAAEPPSELRLTCAQASGRLAREEATIVDLSLSRNYFKAHIPGAWFAIRSRLARGLAKIPLRGALILTSEDGVLAGLAAAEARALLQTPVHYLAGGNAAWQAAGHALVADGANMADDPVDLWLKPYERAGDTTAAMSEYLAWETDLLSAIERDGSTRFTLFQP